LSSFVDFTFFDFSFLGDLALSSTC